MTIEVLCTVVPPDRQALSEGTLTDGYMLSGLSRSRDALPSLVIRNRSFPSQASSGEVLMLTFLGKLSRIGAQNFACGIRGNIQLADDLLHRPALDMEGSPDKGNRTHSLKSPTPSAAKSRMVG